MSPHSSLQVDHLRVICAPNIGAEELQAGVYGVLIVLSDGHQVARRDAD